MRPIAVWHLGVHDPKPDAHVVLNSRMAHSRVVGTARRAVLINPAHAAQTGHVGPSVRGVNGNPDTLEITPMNVYQVVTDRIIEALEAGQAPWRKPWTTAAPLNLISGKPYRGINVWLNSGSSGVLVAPYRGRFRLM
jgi:hypothetical protein